MRKLLVALFFVALIALVSANLEAELLQHGAESMEFFNQRKTEMTLENKLGVSGVRGIDFSQGFSTATLKCLRNQGFVFAIPRGYQSVGRVDPNMRTNVNNAHSAGFKNVDAYLFPCPRCGNPAGQVNALWNAFAGIGSVGMIWLDVEGQEYWMGAAANRSFFQGLLSQLSAIKARAGIYSSAYMWNTLFGSGFNVARSYPLWYAHYDGVPNFSDFSSFGGWSSPSIKQYVGDVTVCNAGVDLNVY